MVLCALCALLSCDNGEGREKNASAGKVYQRTPEKVDADFVAMANDVLNTEIAAGKMAMKKGSDKRIKNLGRIMAKDFTKGHVKLKSLAAAKTIPLEGNLSPPMRDSLAVLDQYTGKDFDEAYIAYVKVSHQKAINLCQEARNKLYDKDIKSIAARGLLVFQRHLETVNGLYADNK